METTTMPRRRFKAPPLGSAEHWKERYDAEVRAHACTQDLLGRADRLNAPLKHRIAELEHEVKRLRLRAAEQETEALKWRLRAEGRTDV